MLILIISLFTDVSRNEKSEFELESADLTQRFDRGRSAPLINIDPVRLLARVAWRHSKLDVLASFGTIFTSREEIHKLTG